jgi:hypothetical protein
MHRLSISCGGKGRLLKAIETDVRNEYQKKLSSAAGFWQRGAVRKKIRREVRERFRRIASPYSLWISLRFRR